MNPRVHNSIDNITSMPIFKLLQAFKLQQYAKSLYELGYGYEVYRFSFMGDHAKNSLISKLNLMPGHRARFMNFFDFVKKTYPKEENSKQNKSKKEMILAHSSNTNKRKSHSLRKYRALDDASKMVMNDNFMNKMLEIIPQQTKNNVLPNVNKTSHSMNRPKYIANSIMASTVYENIRPRKLSDKKRRLNDKIRVNPPPRIGSGKPYSSKIYYSNKDDTDENSEYFRMNETPTTSLEQSAKLVHQILNNTKENKQKTKVLKPSEVFLRRCSTDSNGEQNQKAGAVPKPATKNSQETIKPQNSEYDDDAHSKHVSMRDQRNKTKKRNLSEDRAKRNIKVKNQNKKKQNSSKGRRYQMLNENAPTQKVIPQERIPSASTATHLPRGISSAGTSEKSSNLVRNTAKNSGKGNRQNTGAVLIANTYKNKGENLEISKTIDHSKPNKLPEVGKNVKNNNTTKNSSKSEAKFNQFHEFENKPQKFIKPIPGANSKLETYKLPTDHDNENVVFKNLHNPVSDKENQIIIVEESKNNARKEKQRKQSANKTGKPASKALPKIDPRPDSQSSNPKQEQKFVNNQSKTKPIQTEGEHSESYSGKENTLKQKLTKIKNKGNTEGKNLKIKTRSNQ